MILPNEKTAQGVQKNVVGYALLGLSAAVVTLFCLFLSLNNYIREDLSKQNMEMRSLVDKNNQVLSEMKFILQANQETANRLDKTNAGQRGTIRAQDFINSLYRDQTINQYPNPNP